MHLDGVILYVVISDGLQKGLGVVAQGEAVGEQFRFVGGGGAQ